MKLVTSSLYSPGKPSGQVAPDQVLMQPDLGLMAVADAGPAKEESRAATRMALDALRAHVVRNTDIIDRFKRHPSDELRERILGIVQEGYTRAAKEVYAFQRRHPSIRVSLDVVLMLKHEAFVGHVGTGRVYLVRRGLIHQLTVDHARGDEAQPTDKRVRCLGPAPKVRVESMCMEMSKGDRFVLCGHHLFQMADEQQLQHHLVAEDIDQIAPALKALVSGAPFIGAVGQLGGGHASQPGTGRDRLALLAPIPLFAHCSERELRSIAASTRPKRYHPGQILFRKGDPGTEIYLLISGNVRIENDGKPIVTLGPGSNFGEMAMLDEPHRSADAVVVEDCELLIISRDSFFGLLKGNPMLAVKILWNMLLRLSARLRSTSDRLTELTDAVGIPLPPPVPAEAEVPPEVLGANEKDIDDDDPEFDDDDVGEAVFLEDEI